MTAQATANTPLSTQPKYPAAIQQELIDSVKQAFEQRQPLKIVGGGSKAHYGRAVSGKMLALNEYQGIINYEPSELVITVRAGTPLHVVEAALAEQGQMLGFEPPAFSRNATIGGTIACGLSGPRRPYAGAARDFVLGVTMINGRGEILKFGGQVMKNVAGYDTSRLMCGAQGTLGVLLDISLKVIPIPAYEETRIITANQQQMQTLLTKLGCQPIPLSATLLHRDQLYLRFSGAKAGVSAAANLIGGDSPNSATAFWQQLKEQQHPFFDRARHEGETVWRLSLPPTAADIPDALVSEQIIEWGGAQRWAYSRDNSLNLRTWCQENGGHATCFNHKETSKQVFTPLTTDLLHLSQRIKNSFDPAHILNPERLYPGL